MLDDNNPSLGWRRNVLLVEAANSPDSGRVTHHARSLEAFCSRSGIRVSTTTGAANSPTNNVSSFSFTSPLTSPMFTGSFPSSPLLYGPDIGQRIGQIDLVPPLSLDGRQPGRPETSPKSPKGPGQFSLPVQSLFHRLQNSPQVGIVHLALQSDTTGAILRSMYFFCFGTVSLILCAQRLLSSCRMHG